MNTPMLLVIMDGLGIDVPSDGNAVTLANTPCLDYLFSGKDYPFRTIEASGADVGLPDGQMGNSEVGHLNIGSGRIVYQDLSRINNAIADGSFDSNPMLLGVMRGVRERGGALHLIGLLSDGGVHSEFSHLVALIRLAVAQGVESVMIHPLLDGRDVSPTSGIRYVKKLMSVIAEIAGQASQGEGGAGPDAPRDSASGQASHGEGAPRIEIASLGGRYYAMDRDNRWERVKRGWEAIVVPDPDTARITSMASDAAVQSSYENGITDEFVEPVSFSSRGVLDGDGVVFFNFRPDRAREITRAFTQEGFGSFDRVRAPKVDYVCMTQYDETFDLPIAFPKETPEMVLADAISQLGMRQLHIAETEKYAHVTFFLNGGVEQPKKGEERILIPSPKVATYDLQPEMSAHEVTDALVAAMREGRADFYVVNFANPDMVGHTGSVPAAVAAVETIDGCVGRLVELLKELGGVGIVTADHGNCEKMIADDGSPHTAHTTASVPFVVIDESEGGHRRELAEGEGRLADIAPTLFDLAGIGEAPGQWTGRSLIAH